MWKPKTLEDKDLEEYVKWWKEELKKYKINLRVPELNRWKEEFIKKTIDTNLHSKTQDAIKVANKQIKQYSNKDVDLRVSVEEFKKHIEGEEDVPELFIPTAKFLAAAQIMWYTINAPNPTYTVKQQLATGPKASALLGQVIANSKQLSVISCSKIEEIVLGTNTKDITYTPNSNMMLYHENIVPQLALACGLTLPQEMIVDGLKSLQTNEGDEVSKWFDPYNTKDSEAIAQNLESAVNTILGTTARTKGDCVLDPCIFHCDYDTNPVWRMVSALKTAGHSETNIGASGEVRVVCEHITYTTKLGTVRDYQDKFDPESTRWAYYESPEAWVSFNAGRMDAIYYVSNSISHEYGSFGVPTNMLTKSFAPLKLSSTLQSLSQTESGF